MPRERLLILCKTYPSPSEKYVETSCVAGLRSSGGLVRLYPVPFRLISDEHQFKKWQWIECELRKAPDDHRPESHRLRIDTVKCDTQPIATSRNWALRLEAIANEHIYDDFGDVERSRQSTSKTLALLRPSRITSLEITKLPNPDWTDAEIRKLIQQQNQPSLFPEAQARSLETLRKIPFSFHYSYECDTAGGTVKYRHKIVDWEAGALFWKCKRRYLDGWEAPFRAKLEAELPAKDLFFLMGTIHRFPDQWLIVSLIYPPKSGEITQPKLL